MSQTIYQVAKEISSFFEETDLLVIPLFCGYTQSESASVTFGNHPYDRDLKPKARLNVSLPTYYTYDEKGLEAKSNNSNLFKKNETARINKLKDWKEFLSLVITLRKTLRHCISTGVIDEDYVVNKYNSIIKFNKETKVYEISNYQHQKLFQFHLNEELLSLEKNPIFLPNSMVYTYPLDSINRRTIAYIKELVTDLEFLVLEDDFSEVKEELAKENYNVISPKIGLGEVIFLYSTGTNDKGVYQSINGVIAKDSKTTYNFTIRFSFTKHSIELKNTSLSKFVEEVKLAKEILARKVEFDRLLAEHYPNQKRIDYFLLD